MPDYQLIDFGNGRKLELLQGYRVDRPSPAADRERRGLPAREWERADAFYCARRRQWLFRKPWPTGLRLDTGSFRLPFRPAPSGHIGCFPEQIPHWDWLAQRVQRSTTRPSDSTSTSPSDAHSAHECLNLFAHTGGSTLAMAAAGGTVTHVDAAKPSVQAARRAAQDSQLTAAPIRFLVEDAARFVAREVRRGRRYHTVVLDPPSYGHAPDGKAWRLQRDLWPLLDDCLALLRDTGDSLLITGHGERPDQNEIGRYLRRQMAQLNPTNPLQWGDGRSNLTDRQGRALDAGFFVRFAVERP